MYMDELISSIQRNDPRFWSGKRLFYLKTCLNHIRKTDAGKHDQQWLDTLLKTLLESKSNRDSNDRTTQILESVLSRLAALGFYDGPLPPTRIRVPRPSAIPSTPDHFQDIERASKLVEFFWRDWLAGALSGKEKAHVQLFAFAFSAAADSSLGLSIIYTILDQLEFQDLLSGYSLKTKIHPKDASGKMYPVTLAAPTRLLLNCFLQKTPKASGKVFLPERKARRRKLIIKILAEQYKQCARAYAEKHGHEDAIPTSWSRFARAAQYHSLLDTSIGLEPYITTILKRYPLPACHPTNTHQPITKYDKPCQEPEKPKYRPLKTPSEVTRLIAPDAINHEDDWVGKSKQILSYFLQQLTLITQHEPRITGIKVRRQIQEALDVTRKNADALARSRRNALHLAIDWIEHKITSREITSPSTVRQYLRSVFLNGLLSDASSEDFSTWEPEDHEQLFEDIVGRDSIKSEQSRRKIVSAFKQVYSYGNKHGYFDNIKLTYVAREWGGSTQRNEIIGLHAFDAFIEKLIAGDAAPLLMLATFLVLAYYGCLRSSEISRLTLKDISIRKPFLWITIERGKSAAARRRIPFHLTAPLYAQDIVRKFYNLRKEQFPEIAVLKHIALFGPEQELRRYTQEAMANSTIALLKAQFGKKMVLHSLRHCGCSWLLLRMYAARYPDVRELLVDRDHELFSEPRLREAAYLFSGDPGVTMHPLPCHSGLIRLSKIMGHLGQRTTFSTYIHTFHVIHAHAMKYRVSPVLGARKLDGKLISALFPKMKSRTTQAKIKDKSINGLLALAEH